MIDFKIGQKVWSPSYGNGKITSIYDEDTAYPVYVEFDMGRAADYTVDGKYSKDEQRTLFFKEILIPVDALIPPVQEISLKKGDVVLLKTLDLCIVEEDSDSDNIHFKWRPKVARTLDDAFDTVQSHKSFVEKVVGNIND